MFYSPLRVAKRRRVFLFARRVRCSVSGLHFVKYLTPRPVANFICVSGIVRYLTEEIGVRGD